MYPIRIGGETPVFLCAWNSGAEVEIHTRETLTKARRFDPDDDSWGWEINELMTLHELLIHLENEPLDKGRKFYNDSFMVTRIR